MRDGRVGEEALDVVLRDGDDGAERHRRDGDDGEHQLPGPRRAAEAHVEHAQQGGDGRGLRGDRHEAGDRRRGAHVDVGGPGVERHGADLEEQADRDHDEAAQQQTLRAGVGRDGRVELREAHAPGVAVEQRDAVEHDGRGQRAEQEVLERRLLAEQATTARHRGQQVQRQREDLDGHEQHQQVVGGDEQHHAEDREHQQREDLRVLAAQALGLALERRARHRGGRRGEGRVAAAELPLREERHAAEADDQEEAPEHVGRAVERQEALGGQPDLALDPVQDGQAERDDEADGGERGLREVPPSAGDDALQHDADAADAQQDDERRQQRPLDRRRGKFQQGAHRLPS